LTKLVKGLGIESTAHTFGASIVNESGKILSDIRSIYVPPAGSGIHPREASRHHTDVAASVIKQALTESKISKNDLDFISFSAGPGLGPCLRVGAVIARTLCHYLDKPIVPVNHAIGHIEIAAFEAKFFDPIVLLVSGGHTLVSAFSNGRWRIFGETLDLTIGQLLDQFGRKLGLSSPSGKKIEEISLKSKKYLSLPYTVKGNNVSLSGVITAAKRLLDNKANPNDIAYSIQETGFAMLCEVTERALAFSEKKELLISGGVAANKRLIQMLTKVAERHNSKIYAISKRYSGDCGAQIAWTGLLAFKKGCKVKIEKSTIRQSWRIDTVDIPWRN